MTEEYYPGQKVPRSGIYAVTHDLHAERHEVTCVMNESFPPCRACGNQARFVLIRAAHHIGNHEHFK